MRIKIHKDSSYPLAYHFSGEKSNMRPLFDELTHRLSREMKFEFKIGKTYVGLINRLVFAAVRVQTRKLVFECVSRKEFKSPRIVKSVRFQKARWAQYVELREASDVDSELIDWVRFSYE